MNIFIVPLITKNDFLNGMKVNYLNNLLIDCFPHIGLSLKALLLFLLYVTFNACLAAEVSEQAKIANPQDKTLKLSRQDDQNRPTNQYQLMLGGRTLTIGGEISAESEYRNDFSLDDDLEDDIWDLKTGLDLEFFYQWNTAVTGFVEFDIAYENDLYREDGDEQDEASLELDEAWLLYRRDPALPFSLQLGRQTIRDEYEWWWDESLDAIRFHYDAGDTHAELSVAEELFRTSTANKLDAEDEDVLRILGMLGWNWAPKQTISIFAAHQNDHSATPIENQLISNEEDDERDSDLTWIGLSAKGRLDTESIGNLYYWTNLASVSGSEKVIDFDQFDDGLSIVDDLDSNDISGWAIDLGVTSQTNWTGHPSWTLGYARGSGDSNPKNDKDKNFRSTGLEDYEGKFRGVNRFHYYGEVLQPDLSNLQITTLGLGYPLFNSSSVEFLLHDYRQIVASDTNRIGRIRSRPNGASRQIGQALEIVLGFEDSEHYELELIASAFRAGEAYSNLKGNTALNIRLQLDYNF